MTTPSAGPGAIRVVPLPRRGAGLILAVLAASFLGLIAASPASRSAALDRPRLAARFVADSSAAMDCLNRGQGDSARALVAPLVDQARRLGDSAMVARALLVEVTLDLRMTRLLEAEPKLLAALRLAVAAGDSGVWMRGLQAAFTTRQSRGELAECDRIAARWLALSEATGNRSEQAWARGAMAQQARARGDLATAEVQLAEVERRFGELGELPGLGFALIERGRTFLAGGKDDSAHTCFTGALELARRTDDGRLAGNSLGHLAAVELRSGDPVRGLALAAEAMAGQRARNQRTDFLGSASLLSRQALRLGRVDQATAVAREGVAVAERAAVASEIPRQRGNLADALWAAGHGDSARTLWNRVLEDSLADPEVRALAAGGMAQAWAADDSLAAAGRLLESALARWGARLEVEARLPLEILAAGFDVRLGRPDRVRPRLLPFALRLDAAGDTESGLAVWVQIARADRLTGDSPAADAARAHALSLWEAGPARAPSLETRRRRGEPGQLLLVEALVSTASTDEAFATLQRFRTRSLLDRLAPPGSMGPAARDSFAAASFRTEVLRDGELLLEYVCAPDTTLLFVTSREGLQRFGLPGARVLLPQIELARAAFTARPAAGDATAARLASAALGRLLLGEVADLVLAHPRVLIAPDGVLHGVSFAALTPNGSETPLLAGRSVTLVPSAAFLARARAVIMPAGEDRGPLLAVSGGATRLGSLRGARSEVERLAEHFTGIETRFARADGRIDLAVGELAHHRGLHFAGLSRADDDLPWRSGIVLGGGVGGDSLLTAAEIAATPLDAGLVVLSSCESIGGRAIPGEGVSGLASAFLVAGAPAVVATLWPVDDRVTGDLVQRFYLALARGAAAGDALREAQLALRGQAATAHPFHWAGFVLIGDGDVTLPLHTRALTAERAGVGIALTLVGLVLLLSFAPRLRNLGRGRGRRPVLGIALALALAGVGPSPGRAVEPAYAPAESAAVARAAWAAMRQARAAGDSLAQQAHVARAHAAWPGQWVDAYGLAAAAARTGDAATVARALGDLADLGAGPDLSVDSALVAFARSPAGAAAGCPQALARIARNAQPVAHSTVAFEFPAAESTFWAEGLAGDRASGGYFVADVRRGRVALIDSAGTVHDFARIDARGGWSALAVAVDAGRGLVWVTAAALPQAEGYARADSGRAAMIAYDRASGEVKARHDLPSAPEGHVPGDIQVTRDGDVYVSDSLHPAIYRVHAGRLEEFAADPGFRSLQGQALAPDERWLLVADYAHGLATIDLETRAVRWLPPPPGGSLLGLDGMAWIQGGLVAVQNGFAPPRVVRLHLSGRGHEARVESIEVIDRNIAQADEPTLVTRGPDGAAVYIANAQWEKYDASGWRRPGTVLTAPRGLRLRIPDSSLRRDPPVEDDKP